MAQPRLKTLEGETQTGDFCLSQEHTVPGILTFQRSDTSVRLWYQDQDWKVPDIPSVIRGVLCNAQYVSLLGFHNQISSSGSIGPAGLMSSCIMFPRHISVGAFHPVPSAEEIIEVHFSLDEAHLLCTHTEAFGSLAFDDDAKQVVRQALELEKRETQVGPNPIVVYFTGEHTIFEANTCLGHIQAVYATRIDFSRDSPDQLTSEIVLTLKFDSTVTFQDALKRTYSVVHFLELLIGRPQNITEMSFSKSSDHDHPDTIAVYDCLYPRYHRPESSRSTLRPFMEPPELSRVIANWTGRTESWGAARTSFHNCFAKQQFYDGERLVAAVNMFDLLPEDSIPDPHSPGVKVQDAIQQTRTLFRKIRQDSAPDPEQQSMCKSMLDFLGRLEKTVPIKQKIQYHASIVGDRLEGLTNFTNMTAELCAVVDAAVVCRNFFVHGREPDKKPKYWKNKDILRFITETVEFVFGASDLLASGWEPYTWVTAPKVRHAHPFDDYLVDYPIKYQMFHTYK